MPLTAEQAQDLLRQTNPSLAPAKLKDPDFNPAAEFLLTQGYANLFEDVGDFTVRCKGCKKELKRWDRQAHWANHKRKFKLGW